MIEMAGFSVKFDTRMNNGIEVITLYYRVNGRLRGCKCFSETYDFRTGETRSALLNMMWFVHYLMGCVVEDIERGAHIAAVRGFERGVLDAAEGRSECETLPYDIHRMYEDDYCRGYCEGYCHGNEQPEF